MVIGLNSVEAVAPLKEILRHDRNGVNKIYLKPENNDWDIRIQLAGGYAFANDILSKIRGLPGVSYVKEL